MGAERELNNQRCSQAPSPPFMMCTLKCYTTSVSLIAAGPGSGARAAAASAAAAARANAAGRTAPSSSPGAPATRAPNRGRRQHWRRRRRGQRWRRRRLCSFGSSWPPGNYKSQGAWRRAADGRGGVGAARPEVALEAEVARPRRGLEHRGGTRSGGGGTWSGSGSGGWG